MVAQARKCSALVAPHQAGVADNVCSEDRCQFSLLTGHGNFLPFLQWIVECPERLGNCGEGAAVACGVKTNPKGRRCGPFPILLDELSPPRTR